MQGWFFPCNAGDFSPYALNNMVVGGCWRFGEVWRGVERCVDFLLISPTPTRGGYMPPLTKRGKWYEYPQKTKVFLYPYFLSFLWVGTDKRRKDAKDTCITNRQNGRKRQLRRKRQKLKKSEKYKKRFHTPKTTIYSSYYSYTIYIL